MKKFFCAATVVFALNFSVVDAADVSADKASLDIYNFDGAKINLQNFSATLKKLEKLSPNDATVLRAKVYLYRRDDKIQDAFDLCRSVLQAKKNPPELLIEACLWAGDICLNDRNDRDAAREFVDCGIALVKQKFSQAEIDSLVNGTNVEVSDLKLIGHSNTIRELYILKADIENVNPKFDTVSVVEELALTEDRLYNIKYRTDW